MWKEKYEALEKDHKELVQHHDALAARVQDLETALLNATGKVPPRSTSHQSPVTSHAMPTPGPSHAPANGDFDALYQAIVARAQNDPGILELLARRPELHVKVERPVISMHANQVDGWIATLIAAKFLDTPKDRSAIGDELVRRGRLKPTANRKILSPALSRLSQLGFLTIEPTGYQAVAGMKIEIREASGE